MYSISLFIAALCVVFLYRAQHPEAVAIRAGLIQLSLPELKRNPVMRVALRIRAVLGATAMLLFVVTGYVVPVEIGQALATAQERQSQLQMDRFQQRLTAEKRHAVSMIDALGGQANYLTYLQSVRNVN